MSCLPLHVQPRHLHLSTLLPASCNTYSRLIVTAGSDIPSVRSAPRENNAPLTTFPLTAVRPSTDIGVGSSLIVGVFLQGLVLKRRGSFAAPPSKDVSCPAQPTGGLASGHAQLPVSSRCPRGNCPPKCNAPRSALARAARAGPPTASLSCQVTAQLSTSPYPPDCVPTPPRLHEEVTP